MAGHAGSAADAGDGGGDVERGAAAARSKVGQVPAGQVVRLRGRRQVLGALRAGLGVWRGETG